jgi:4'-phosphopantetheinyl transferase
MKTKTPDAFAAETKSQPARHWMPTPPLVGFDFPTGRVDVWKVRLQESQAAAIPTTTTTTTPTTTTTTTTTTLSAPVLSEDETVRANRFHFERDRLCFARCRSALRQLLSIYLSIPAAEILFEYLPGGKPQLAAKQNPRVLQFNVSHSSGMALIAIGSQHAVGVDIEEIRNDVDTRALSERLFSVRERAALRELPDRLRIAAFFACWTRKEAFLKATGDGLAFPLADFSVTAHPDLHPEIEEIKGDTQAGKQWRLEDLAGIDGFRAALATGRSNLRVATYGWN